MSCLTDLIGLKSVCETTNTLFLLDDIEGMTQTRLSQLATERDGSGKSLAVFLTESAARLMLADIDSIIPTNYRITNELFAVCSSCTFSGFYNTVAETGTGIIIKNMSNSRFTSILIESLKVKLNTTGNFTLRIQDTAGNLKEIQMEFVAGEELNITGIRYETFSKQVNIYFTDPSIEMFTITCPASSSCGCGGISSKLASDIAITGYNAGSLSSTQYGILPCVKIRCSYDDIICDLIKSSPRIFGITLLYLTASKAFEENVMSTRINRTASFDKEEKQSESERYYQLYRERLMGSSKKGVLGIAQTVSSNLKTIKDKCVSCDNPLGIAWAIG